MIIGFCPVKARAEVLKDGYTLTPTLYGKTGVDLSSSFRLTTPDVISLSDVKEMVAIDGQPRPEIVQISEREFLITPRDMSPNSLYIFRLTRGGKPDITWAFQTSVKFQVTSSLPSDRATNVPVSSGIEITFSCEGCEPLDEYFSISPKAEGRFEYHKNTAVFVPKSLGYKTLYTVTLKSGIGLEGGSEKTAEDYAFSFETEAAPEEKPASRNIYPYFYKSYTELPSIEPPRIDFWIYGNSSANAKVSVYEFGGDEAVSAVCKLASVPNWARYAREDSYIDTSGMKTLMSFDSTRYFDIAKNVLTIPRLLPLGFYLIYAEIDGARAQMILQISDLPVQVIADSGKAIVWVNDIVTGKATAGARVYDCAGDKTYLTDANGIAIIDRTLDNRGFERLNIKGSDGKECVWLTGYGYFYNLNNPVNSRDEYWTYLQLDRTLFKRDDTVSFWGYAQNRKTGEDIQNLSAVLTQGYSGPYGTNTVLQKQVLPVISNVYSGELALPNLDVGSYVLSIYYGDIVLSSTYFNVEDFVKPPYKMDVTADKKSIFAGETVNFTVKAGFFEGTPVSGLDVSYRLWSYYLDIDTKAQAKTDINGEVTVPVKTAPYSDAQGQTTLMFTAEATLPEIGATVKNEYVRVFLNDINLDADATRNGRNAEISVNVNYITLDRLNDGTAKSYYDYIGAPARGKDLTAEIYRAYWVSEKTGEYYDYIEKKKVPKYYYNYKEEIISRFSMSTNADGAAARKFTVPDRERESYYAVISCLDGNGRKVSTRRYIGQDYSSYYSNLNNNDYYLDGAGESYAVGGEVRLTLKCGEETVNKGGFMFITTQNGITDCYVGKNPFVFTFAEENIPNVRVAAYYFDGYNYKSNYRMNANICFDYSQNDLTLTAETDKASYKPGDMCTVTVTAKDKDGHPKAASVNISVVDEALFALKGYSADTLASLYRSLPSGLRLTSSTHGGYISSDEPRPNPMTGGGDINEITLAEEPPAGAPDDTYFRETFKDTAFFGTVLTNETGEAVYSFRLPDNITSWRLTTSGISGDLYAGSATENIKVTNPMFINYTLNDTFLTGDAPAAGVSVYGTSLTGAEKVSFEIWDESAPDIKFTASGAAFERVNIPIGVLTKEGPGALVIKASVSNGMSDAVKHSYIVLDTYRAVDAAAYYNAVVGTKFIVGDGGLTNITFTDKSRGQYLYQLIGLRYAYGDRLEKLVAKREATRLIAKYFTDLELYDYGDGFNPLNYQRGDGGIAILPYADSDVETTVKLMRYIKDDIDLNALKRYLYGILNGEVSANKACALYGLAQLQEPVLLSLDAYAQLEDISVKDAAYVALAYCALGEVYSADEIFKVLIAPRLEHIAPYYRVNTGVDNDDILTATSAAAMLAAKLGKPEREGLYQYYVKNHTTDALISLERLAYIEAEIGKTTAVSGSITYTLYGEEYTRELNNGDSYTLRIPARNISEFKLIYVTGSVAAVSSYKKPMKELTGVDNDVAVSRRYYKANGEVSSNTFSQGDLVRVQIWIDYSKKAIDGSYCVTDYLPAGLEYVSNSAKISGYPGFGWGYYRYATVEGQKITFYDYNRRFDKGCLYYYYARVVSPGVFKAEGTLVQNLAAKDYISAGRDDLIIIR